VQAMLWYLPEIILSSSVKKQWRDKILGLLETKI
jgi:hypothetical protein